MQTSIVMVQLLRNISGYNPALMKILVVMFPLININFKGPPHMKISIVMVELSS